MTKVGKEFHYNLGSATVDIFGGLRLSFEKDDFPKFYYSIVNSDRSVLDDVFSELDLIIENVTPERVFIAFQRKQQWK